MMRTAGAAHALRRATARLAASQPLAARPSPALAVVACWRSAAAASASAAPFSTKPAAAATPAAPSTEAGAPFIAVTPAVDSSSSSSSSAAASPSDSPVVSASFPAACQATPLPPGVRVVRSFVLPPAPPPLTAAERRARAQLARQSETGWQRIERWGLEYHEQLVRKLTEPHKVLWEAYGAFWTQQWRRWSRRFGIVLRIMPRPLLHKLIQFDENTDLRSFTLLNDNNFGGSTVSGLELRERVEVDPATGKEVKKYSVVFKGELRTMMPIDPDSLNPAPGRKPPVRASMSAPELLNKPAPMRPMDSGPTFGAPTAATAITTAPSSTAAPSSAPAAPAAAPSASSSTPSVASFSDDLPSDLDPLIAPRAAVASSSSSSSSSTTSPSDSSAAALEALRRLRDNRLEDTTPTEQFFGRPLGPAEWAQGYGRQQQPGDQQQQQQQRTGDSTAESTMSQLPLSQFVRGRMPQTKPNSGDDSSGGSGGLKLMPRSFSERLAASGATGPINGFAAVIFPPFPYPDMDLEWFDFLALRLRTDGRRYIFNVRARESTWSSTAGYIWQSQLRAESPPRPFLHKMEVRMENFVCTQHGRAKNFGSPLPRERVESFGFSVTGPPGPFELEVELIEARAGVPEFELRQEWEARKAQQLERDRRIAERVARAEQRAKVQAELAKLKSERNEAASREEFERQVLAPLFAGKLDESAAAKQQQTEADLDGSSAFPREFQRQRQAEAAAELSKRSKKKGGASMPPKSSLTQKQREDIATLVDQQMKHERDSDPDLLPFGKRIPKDE